LASGESRATRSRISRWHGPSHIVFIDHSHERT
jgi:hypothetical protein